MRKVSALPFGLIFFFALPASVSAATEEAGRDVSVALFSSRVVHSLTLTPIGRDAWTASCLRCVHTRLADPIHLTGPVEMFAGGMIRATEDESGEARTAAGLLHVRSGRRGGEVSVVLTVPSERYVSAVLNGEAALDEPAQSLQSLAILARTYALNGSHFTPQAGQLPADVCDSTQCQALRLGPVSPAIEQAVRGTAGETLWFGPHRAEVFFSQSCGGLTEDGGALWPRLRGVPYLRSHSDPYCLRRDSAAWHAEIPLTEFAAIVRSEGWRIPGEIVAARVVERSSSHRALRVALIDGKGSLALLAASALRFGVGRALGWDRVRSDAYEVGVRNGMLVFDGRGHGHGIGLCQAGAAEMAAEGKDARAILSFYFPGTVAGITPRGDGWQETRLGAITLRFIDAPSSAQDAAIRNAWADAQRRFPPRHAVAPEIVFAPTTELFRQMTAQPGWALASTHGSTIVVQPEWVLEGGGRGPSGTLLHEMLHVLVEAEASERAPLWLREGIVEVLAEEADGADSSSSMSSHSMSTAAIDSALMRADSRDASERAHHAAAVRVRALIARYGKSAVRGWLSSGPPAGAA